jgi:hypothetical protein
MQPLSFFFGLLPLVTSNTAVSVSESVLELLRPEPTLI